VRIVAIGIEAEQSGGEGERAALDHRLAGEQPPGVMREADR
jgi:hypothetical protein